MIGIFKNGVFKWGRNKGSQITGEKIPGDLDTWNLLNADINEALELSLEDLQKRSISLYHTYGPLASAINKTTSYAIGSGNVFRSHPDHRVLGITEDEAKEWGKKFQLLIHYNFKKLSWYEKQSVVFRGALISGDSLVYFIRDEDGLDLIDSAGTTIDFAKSDGESWTLGIKHDKYLRRKAIFTNEQIDFVNSATKDQQVIQFMLKEMPRQLRGLPIAYKIIALAKNHDRHMDATVQRAVLESIMMAYSSADSTDLGAQMNNQVAAARKKQGRLRTAFSKITGSRDLAGGNIYQLKSGEDLKFTDLKTPGSNFDQFNDWMIKFIAMATDTTPGIILSSYPTSYSSHRGEFNDFWKMVQFKRNVFNEKVNKVVIKELAKQMIMDGSIEAPGFFNDDLIAEAWLAGSFLGPVPGHLNPRQEVEAYRIAVENGFLLRSDVANLYGNEYENVINEWGELERNFKELSMTDREKAIQDGLINE